MVSLSFVPNTEYDEETALEIAGALELAHHDGYTVALGRVKYGKNPADSLTAIQITRRDGVTSCPSDTTVREIIEAMERLGLSFLVVASGSIRIDGSFDFRLADSLEPFEQPPTELSPDQEALLERLKVASQSV